MLNPPRGYLGMEVMSGEISALDEGFGVAGFGTKPKERCNIQTQYTKAKAAAAPSTNLTTSCPARAGPSDRSNSSSSSSSPTGSSSLDAASTMMDRSCASLGWDAGFPPPVFPLEGWRAAPVDTITCGVTGISIARVLLRTGGNCRNTGVIFASFAQLAELDSIAIGWTIESSLAQYVGDINQIWNFCHDSHAPGAFGRSLVPHHDLQPVGGDIRRVSTVSGEKGRSRLPFETELTREQTCREVLE